MSSSKRASRRGGTPALAWVAGALGLAGVAAVGFAVVSGVGVGTGSATGVRAAPGVAAPAVQSATAEGAAAGGAAAEDAAADAEVAAGIAALADPTWLTETAGRHGIPERVLAAYAGADLVMRAEAPACGIDWTTLAGIGYVESHHGTIFGGAVSADGLQAPAILGIALDGTSTDAIPDTDGGALDGDAAWDRAVGPMQIIPETWSRFAGDGNADGISDPQQIDDAVLTAARYLCADAFDLNTPEGWIAAVAAYNTADEYNASVVEATTRYRATA